MNRFETKFFLWSLGNKKSNTFFIFRWYTNMLNKKLNQKFKNNQK